MKRTALFVSLVALAVVACKQSTPTPEPSTTMATQDVDRKTDDPAVGSAEPVAVAGAAAPADPWHKAKPARDPIARPFLWSIARDGKTSYALGTIHVGVDAESRLPDVVWAKLDAAPVFAMETDLSDPSLAKMLECVRCSLRHDLGATYWAKLEQAIGPDVAARLDGMKPMVAATMLSLRGLDSTAQMDSLLLARATNGGKRIVYLEPASDQGAILEKWMNAKALKVMLADLDGGLASTKAMLAAYVEGDEAKMVASADAERAMSLKHGYTSQELDESLDDLLYKRNAAWIKPIEELHAAGGGFIAVGALHLMGPRSVLELLAAQGYTVTRVTK